MTELDATIRRQMVAGGKAIGLLSALLASGGLATMAEPTRDLVRQAIGEWYGAPYPQHCRHPEKCAGKGSCPRDPVCID
jgi:hypothetical protein